jgi:TRAP-type transport system periplasmic protein
MHSHMRLTARSRRVTSLALLAVLAAACDVASADPDELTTVRLGHVYDPAYPVHTCGVEPLTDDINERDVGLTIEVYPASQLGSEKDLLEQAIADQIDLVIAGPSQLAEFYEPIAVFDAAYAFEDVDELMDAVDSETGQQMFEELRRIAGVRVLDVWLYGTRHMTALRPVRSPDDLHGVKLRVQEAPVFLETARALGSSPTAVAFGEVYLALQQGIVDAAEGPATATEDMSFYEVADYFSLTNHVQSSIPVVVNEEVWSSLDTEQQAALQDGVTRYRDDVRQCLEDEDEESMARWQEEGVMQVVDDVDVEAFRAAAYEHFSEGFVWSDLYREWSD